MSKFKPGEKVKVIASTYSVGHPARNMIGDVCEIYSHNSGTYLVYNIDYTQWERFYESDLQAIEEEPMKKELKDMQVGDVLVVDKGNHKMVVVEVLNNCFIAVDHHSGHAHLQSFKQAEENGWRFKDQPTPKKLTKAEIEEKLGYSVEIVEES